MFPRIRKYTLAIFLERAKIVHGDEFDYSGVRPEHISGGESHVPIKCNKCSWNWSPRIKDHINKKSKCPSCTNHLKITLESFLIRAAKVHGNEFDYSRVTHEHMTGCMSHIPVICKTCNYKWSPSINDHLNGKYGCPSCSDNVKWTYDRLCERIKYQNRVQFNYEKILPGHVMNCGSKIPVTCNNCGYCWDPTIVNHIVSEHGCPDCGGKVPWTYERFITRATSIHKNLYSYELVSPFEIICSQSEISISCTRCGSIRKLTVTRHIYSKSGCRECNQSEGEKQCMLVLKAMDIAYQTQYRLSTLPRKRYDVYFEMGDNKYIIEFDGIQHFEYGKFFHKGSIEMFKEKQEVDVEKTLHAKINEIKLIRIDYTQIGCIEYHIKSALEILAGESDVYYSDSFKYEYIITRCHSGIDGISHV